MFMTTLPWRRGMIYNVGTMEHHALVWPGEDSPHHTLFWLTLNIPSVWCCSDYGRFQHPCVLPLETIKVFFYLMNSLNLVQLVSAPTQERRHALNLVLAHGFIVGDAVFFDHMPIILTCLSFALKHCAYAQYCRIAVFNSVMRKVDFLGFNSEID